jgi:hypothetical protein
MTTPAADRLIFAGEEFAKICINKAINAVCLRGSAGDGVHAQAWASAEQLKAQPPNQSPKQHLAAIRADRRARAQRQKPRLKKPITY